MGTRVLSTGISLKHEHLCFLCVRKIFQHIAPVQYPRAVSCPLVSGVVQNSSGGACGGTRVLIRPQGALL